MRILPLLALASPGLALNATRLAQTYFGNDAPWYIDRIPLFESSDSTIQDVYYYRWSIFRAHQRDLGADGYISTEFLNDVSWQTQPSALLIDATNFHLREGRWCRDRRFKDDYASFIFGPNRNPYQFSESMADGVWQGYLVDGVAETATAHLDVMREVYDGWNTTTMSTGGFDTSKGLYWIQPLTDATEYTIASIDASGGADGFTGGTAFRPSINSYQYANALAIANLASLAGDASLAETYKAKAAVLKRTVQNSLWNSTFEHFIDRYKVDNNYVTYWDFIRGRELVGYVPWTHDLPDDTTTFAQSWKHLLDSSKFAASHGLRTNEPSYEYYMQQYRYEGSNPECQWNGPSWPYQTTQALTALANLLDHYPKGAATNLVSRADYISLLRQYAQIHYNPSRGGILDLEEDYNGDTGAPIVGLTRSPHYFHSGFIDLVLSGLVGIRPRADNTLEVNPLVDSSITYFRAQNILYHGHDIAVQWDVDGSRYGRTGLVVEVDGVVTATSPALSRLTVSISRKTPPVTTRPIAVSVQLSSSTTYPRGSVSTGTGDSTAIHAAIDGRTWFYPESEVANGWDSPVGNGNDSVWYAIDFGDATQISSAEIAFFANATQGFDVPDSYKVQVLQDSDQWIDVSGAEYGGLVANGVTGVSWDSVSSKGVRVVFVPKEGARVRIVEFKVFGS